MATEKEKTYTLKELKKKLTEKEKNFCHEYVIDWNGARAARVAGYSEKTCTEIASQNLIKLHIGMLCLPKTLLGKTRYW